MHLGHKLLELEDKESLQKENINIDSFKNELDEFYEKIINLKKK